MFVYLRNPDEPDEELDGEWRRSAGPGTRRMTLEVHGAADLGRVFFFAEFATAVAGWVLGINPFDQPNVQEAKDNTAKVLEGGDLPEVDPGDLAELLKAAEPPHYVAILGFAAPSEEIDAAVAELRSAIRDATRATTTFGYGPRYLHSTGQFHKGGPPVGLFLELVHRARGDAEIPGAGYAFEHLKERAGDRRPADAARPRPDRRAGAARRATPREGVRELTAAREGGARMKLGFIGLGKMGGNMVHRIHRDSDHEVVAFDFSAEAVKRGRGPRRRRRGVTRGAGRAARAAARGLGHGAVGRSRPRRRSNKLGELLDAGDMIIDGGNSRWTDDKARAAALEPKGIHYVDVGTSGGVWGLEVGYCMMVGGPDEAVERLAPDPRRAGTAARRRARARLGALRRESARATT